MYTLEPDLVGRIFRLSWQVSLIFRLQSIDLQIDFMGNTAALWISEDLVYEVWPDDLSCTNMVLECEVAIEDRADYLEI